MLIWMPHHENHTAVSTTFAAAAAAAVDDEDADVAMLDVNLPEELGVVKLFEAWLDL